MEYETQVRQGKSNYLYSCVTLHNKFEVLTTTRANKMNLSFSIFTLKPLVPIYFKHTSPTLYDAPNRGLTGPQEEEKGQRVTPHSSVYVAKREPRWADFPVLNNEQPASADCLT